MLVYIDTCVYLNLFNSEKGKWLSYDDIALNIFNRCLDCEFRIVVSDWLIYELERNCSSEQQLSEFFTPFAAKGKIVKVQKTREDVTAAKRLSPHFQDALHVLLTKKGGADIILTRNLKDFFQYKSLLQSVLPENF